MILRSVIQSQWTQFIMCNTHREVLQAELKEQMVTQKGPTEEVNAEGSKTR